MEYSEQPQLARNFQNHYFYFLNKIKNKEPFALARYGDGELFIIDNKPIDLSKKYNGEHLFNPDLHQNERKRLIDAMFYEHPNYYVGIPCRCCIGDINHEKIKCRFSNEKQLTWANIFVNSNYRYFIKHMLPLLNDSILICHEKAELNGLPLRLKKDFRVGVNSWVNNLDTITEIKEYIEKNDTKNQVFLFSAGVLSNIAVKELFQFNKNNIYLDIGSILDVWLKLGATRKYLRGGNTLNKTCIW